MRISDWSSDVCSSDLIDKRLSGPGLSRGRGAVSHSGSELERVMRRVVVTGLGMVSPLGGDVETSWKNILAAKSGAGPIARFDATDYACKIACEVKPADHEYGFDPSKDRKSTRLNSSH